MPFKYVSAFILSLTVLFVGCQSDQSLSVQSELTDSTGSTATLGSISFITSTENEEAQRHFIRGLSALHNFWYPEAKEAFEKAREEDEDFALAYWGGAMAHNRTLWQNQEKTEALDILNILGEQQNWAARAKLPEEKALMESLTLLYGDDEDKLKRDQKYMVYMRGLTTRFPQHQEIKALYALSILGILRDNQGNEKAKMEAAAVAQRILDENPKHPGALHYKIHALDDPTHAVLALDAARQYGKVAPESNHARHMPSHIFLQLGLWEEVKISNISALKASNNWVSSKNLPLTMLDNHSLAWLAYANMQLGLFNEAESQLAIINKNNQDTASKRSYSYAADIVSRLWIENYGERSDLNLTFYKDKKLGTYSRLGLLFALAWQALENRDETAYESAFKSIGNIELNAQMNDESYDLALSRIYKFSLQALNAYISNNDSESFEYFDKAIAIEESLNPPTGPPDMIKPVHELYGEILNRNEDYNKAIEMFRISLERTPNRSMSQLGIARAYRQSDNLAAAKYHYTKFSENYLGTDNDPNQTEALSFIHNNQDLAAIQNTSETNQKKVAFNYDEKLKITQCMPLN